MYLMVFDDNGVIWCRRKNTLVSISGFIYYYFHSYAFLVDFGVLQGRLVKSKKDKRGQLLSLNVSQWRRPHTDLSYCSGNGPSTIFLHFPQSAAAFQPITMSDLSSFSTSLIHSLLLTSPVSTPLPPSCPRVTL